MLVRLVQRKYEQENLHNKTLLTPTGPVAKVAYGFIAHSGGKSAMTPPLFS
jgi:hypothetical protein